MLPPARGDRAALALVAAEHGGFTPAVPAGLAARAIAEGRVPHAAWSPPTGTSSRTRSGTASKRSRSARSILRPPA